MSWKKIWIIGLLGACMPAVLPEYSIYCEAENRRWILENCPNVSFVY